jgi:hypothetical protein
LPGSFRKYRGMEGDGASQTSSPSLSYTSFPPRHSTSPSSRARGTGAAPHTQVGLGCLLRSIRLYPFTGYGVEVESCFTSLYIHSKPSADRGEPVCDISLNVVRSAACLGLAPMPRRLLMYEALQRKSIHRFPR